MFNADQLTLAERTAGCARTLYNIGLDQRRWFGRPGRTINYVSQAHEIGDLKEAFPWFGEVPHHCLQQALVDLETAYKNFWSGRAKAPRPRKRGIEDSFRFPDPTQIRLEGNLHVPDKRRTRSIKQAYLKLPKFGRVRCILHRQIPASARILSVTIRRDGIHWVAAVTIEHTVADPKDRSTEAVVGIDLGVAQPVVLSTGERYDLPKATKGDLEHQARLQRRVASKQKTSNNRRKAIRRLAAFKSRCTRRRRDAMEKVTTAIAKNHGVIAMEDLRVRGMTASARGTVEAPGTHVAAKAGLNRSILDVAPGTFRIRLGQKLAASGGVQLLVPAHHTSQRCRKCGTVDAKSRVDRDHFACVEPSCGHTEDADLNAACNIRDRAMGRWGNVDLVQTEASFALLREQQAKPKRRFKKKQSTGGRPAQACKKSGLHHGFGRKRVAATRPSSLNEAARSSAL